MTPSCHREWRIVAVQFAWGVTQRNKAKVCVVPFNCTCISWCRSDCLWNHSRWTLKNCCMFDHLFVPNLGYLEDRRPASNMDPYVVTSLLAETTILWQPTLEAEARAAKELQLQVWGLHGEVWNGNSMDTSSLGVSSSSVPNLISVVSIYVILLPH